MKNKRTDEAHSVLLRRRLLTGSALAVVLLTVGGVVGWAGKTVLTPAPDVLAAESHTTVTVQEGSVGSSLALNAEAQWSTQPVGANLAAGTVTSVALEPGGEANQGTELYAVDLRPVVVGKGDTPAFRALSADTAGDDVEQLQVMLKDLGYFTASPDGFFRASTTAAVNRWQKANNLPQDGTVHLGDVLFVPSLPARLSLDGDLVARGATLSGGESVIRALDPAPTFTVAVTETQAGLAPEGTVVDIRTPKGTTTWKAKVAKRSSAPDGGQTLSLKADRGTVCADDCDEVPVTGKTLLQARLITIPNQKGLVVPSAALKSQPDGSLVVIAADGTEHAVTVSTTARGMSIIAGVSAGTKVQVPAVG